MRQGSERGWQTFNQRPPVDPSYEIGAIREATSQNTRRIERLEDSVDHLSVQFASSGAGDRQPETLSARLKEWLKLLASIKELCIWLALLVLGMVGLVDPSTAKAYLLSVLTLGG